MICAWAGRACVLAAVGGAAMVLIGGGPAGDQNPGSPPTTQPIQSASIQQPQIERVVFQEFPLLVGQLKLWDGPAPDSDDPKAPANPLISEPTDRLAFLGVIKMGKSQRALLSVDGRQRFLREGQTFGDTTLVSIADTHVMLRTGARNRRLIRQIESTDRIGLLGTSTTPGTTTTSDEYGDTTVMDERERSRAMRRELSDRQRFGSDSGAQQLTVPAAKARNLPGGSDDGQEGS